MDAINILLSWQFILFALAVFTIIFILRTILQYVWKQYSSSHLYNEVIMPLAPLLVGAIVSLLAKSFPYPNGLTSSSGRLMFGLVAAMFSGVIYKIVKSTLTKYLSSNDQKLLGDK